MAEKNRQVFVVHGRNLAARDAMFQFLRSIDLQPIEWSQAIESTGMGAPYIGDVLDTAFAAAQAVVVLMTPDEVTYLRKEYGHGEQDDDTRPAGQARPNVLFEAGMALGRSPERTILVALGSLRPFSDIAGRHILHLRQDSQCRQDLARRLVAAGCAVDTSGTDWLQAGNFTPPEDHIDGRLFGQDTAAGPAAAAAPPKRMSPAPQGGNRIVKNSRGTFTQGDNSPAVHTSCGNEADSDD